MPDPTPAQLQAIQNDITNLTNAATADGQAQAAVTAAQTTLTQAQTTAAQTGPAVTAAEAQLLADVQALTAPPAS